MRFGFRLLFLTVAVFAADVEVSDDDAPPAPTQEQDADEWADGVDDVSAHVKTEYFLPSFADNQFPIGKPVTFLINFINEGQEVLNISRVAAFLHSPFDLNYYIQNFSASEVRGGMVGPKSQMSLDYTFTSDPTLEPLEFWMSGVVEYLTEGSDTVYKSTFLNQTVTLVGTGSGIDFTVILSTLVLIGGLVAGVYYLITSTKKGTKAKKKLGPRTVVSEADKAAAAASWDMPAFQRSSGKGPKKMRK